MSFLIPGEDQWAVNINEHWAIIYIYFYFYYYYCYYYCYYIYIYNNNYYAIIPCSPRIFHDFPALDTAPCLLLPGADLAEFVRDPHQQPRWRGAVQGPGAGLFRPGDAWRGDVSGAVFHWEMHQKWGMKGSLWRRCVLFLGSPESANPSHVSNVWVWENELIWINYNELTTNIRTWLVGIGGIIPTWPNVWGLWIKWFEDAWGIVIQGWNHRPVDD